MIALGALATIFVLVRAISIPDEFFFAGRGIGIWISLARRRVALIVAGLLQAPKSYSDRRRPSAAPREHVERVVDADVDAREARSAPPARRAATRAAARPARAPSRRRSSTVAWPDGNEYVAGTTTSGSGSGSRERRPVAADHALSAPETLSRDEDRDATRVQSQGRRHENPESATAIDEPDDAEGADEREPLEERIEHADAVLDDPVLELAVEADRGVVETGSSCFVDSISERGSNGLPMKPARRATAASAAARSSTLPLNMITGIAPTPCAPARGAASPSRRPAASSRRAGSGRASSSSSAASPSSALPASRTV